MTKLTVRQDRSGAEKNTPDHVEKIGLIGVGTMGMRIASAFRAGSRPFAVCDIDPMVIARERAMGTRVADSAVAVAEFADLVLISVPLPEDVQEVVAGEQGLLAASSRPRFIVDLSTVDPGTSRRLSEAARARGVHYLDAPVLGRPATCGHWTLPVGGDPADVEAVAPILGEIASRIIHVGPVGAGNAVKLLNNLMFGAINAITVECMATASKVGVDAEVFFSTVVDSGAATVSNLFRELGPKILENDWSPVFSLALLEKDNRLGLQMAEMAGMQVNVARAVAHFNELGLRAGLGGQDTSALIQLLIADVPANVPAT